MAVIYCVVLRETKIFDITARDSLYTTFNFSELQLLYWETTEIFRTSRNLHPSSKKVMFIVAKILSSIEIWDEFC